MNKIIIIVGPTASGKTGLSLVLTKKFNGEIISADSRQVYREMDIATAKIKNKKLKIKNSRCGCEAIAEGIPHHLIDIVNPNENFTAADFKVRAGRCIEDILRREKTPFIVGGTGLYIKALIDDLDFAKVQPNIKLREELEKKSLEELVEMLRGYNPEAIKKIDIKNPRRVVRAVEIALSKSLPEEGFRSSSELINTPLFFSRRDFEFLQLGIKIPQTELYRRIDERIDNQIKEGLIEEVKKLSEKYSPSIPSMTGIGYRQMGYYLCGEMSLVEAVRRLKFDTHHYAKRQVTWFKRDKSIQWLDGDDTKTAEALVRRFLGVWD